METFVKLNSQTAGKDKLFRLLQYLSRLLWHRLQQKGISDFDKLKALEYQFSTFRKLLRLGKCVEALYAVLPLVDHPDLTIRFTLSLSKISTSLFLLCDHMIWLSRTGIFEIETEKWSTLASKYWLYSITMNLVRDFYEIMQILKYENALMHPVTSSRTPNELFVSVGKMLLRVQSHRKVMVDMIKNGCDFFIPLTALGYTKLSPSVIGALGVISSIAGLITVLDNKCKLTPS